jgi:hypothetical protein
MFTSYERSPEKRARRLNRKQAQPTKNKMKRLLTILISCSLALATGAMAQEDDASQQPQGKQEGGHRAAKEAHSARELRPANEARQMQNQGAVRNERALRQTPKEGRHALKTQTDSAAPAVTNAPATGAAVNADDEHKNRHGARKENAMATKPATSAPAANTAYTSTATAAMTGMHGNGVNQQRKLQAQAKKPDAQKVQKIKSEHASFKAQPKPEQVPAVTFNQSHRINGSDQWQGEKYQVFRSYRPEMHDRQFYHSHYQRIELIGGGYYFWNQGYWYPAWGYDTSAQYYAYDGPIYVGSSAEPPDQVIADVQALLQEQGYYQGEVDGLLGPLTRQALADYQSDNGLYATEAIDEPTLESLGLA